jgi:hypothetical protein
MADGEQLAEVVAAEPDPDKCSIWIMAGLSLCASVSLFYIVAILTDDPQHCRFITAVLTTLLTPLILVAPTFFFVFLALLCEQFGWHSIYTDPRRRLVDDVLMFMNRYI